MVIAKPESYDLQPAPGLLIEHQIVHTCCEEHAEMEDTLLWIPPPNEKHLSQGVIPYQYRALLASAVTWSSPNFF